MIMLLRLFFSVVLIPLKFFLIPFKILRSFVEAPRKEIDKSLGRTRCPSCRSSDVYKYGRK